MVSFCFKDKNSFYVRKTSVILVLASEFMQLEGKMLTWKNFDVRNVHWFFPEAHIKLKDLKSPTLVVYGDKDSEDIQEIADIFEKNIKNVKTNIIKDVDHLLNFEKPEELNKLILNFLWICISWFFKKIKRNKKYNDIKVSRPAELPLWPLAEPYLTLSCYTAPIKWTQL